MAANLIINWLKEASLGFLEFLYPIGCRGCSMIGHGYLCSPCMKKVIFIEDPKCKHCSIPLQDETRSFCSKCALGLGHHDGGISIALYDNPMGNLIRELKYSREKGIATFLAGMISSRLSHQKSINSNRFDYLHPVPLTKLRKRLRGFNQSELIAKELAKQTGIPYHDDILIRVKETESLTGMGIDERMKTIRGAFQVVDSSKVNGRSIILIDDVMTTGATIEECAKVLKLSGASKVKFITVARQLSEDTPIDEIV